MYPRDIMDIIKSIKEEEEPEEEKKYLNCDNCIEYSLHRTCEYTGECVYDENE